MESFFSVISMHEQMKRFRGQCECEIRECVAALDGAVAVLEGSGVPVPDCVLTTRTKFSPPHP